MMAFTDGHHEVSKMVAVRTAVSQKGTRVTERHYKLYQSKKVFMVSSK